MQFADTDEREGERDREIHNFSTFHSHLECSRRNSIVPHSGAHRAAESAKSGATSADPAASGEREGEAEVEQSERGTRIFAVFVYSQNSHTHTHIIIIIILAVTAATPGLPKKVPRILAVCATDEREREGKREVEQQKGIEEALELGPGSVGRLQSQRQRLLCLSWSSSTAATSTHTTKQTHT